METKIATKSRLKTKGRNVLSKARGTKGKGELRNKNWLQKFAVMGSGI